MKGILLLLNLLFWGLLYGQTPQIALVKPDGSTSIYTNFSSAYEAADDDDRIYLPGIIISGNYTIEKKIFLYGAGSLIDSCYATGITKYSGIFQLFPGSDGSEINGINFSNLDLAANQITLKSCIFDNVIHIIDTISNSIFINNLIKSGIVIANGKINNSLISNNIITSGLSGASDYNSINNNLILFPYQLQNLVIFSNSSYNNNIFHRPYGNIQVSNSIFYNNTNDYGVSSNGNQSYNGVYENLAEIFINPGISPYYYQAANDYHVLETSQCHNSGTDGTDRGIYGGTYPWKEGMVPSNPHIFFKNISDTSNQNGDLPINVKVKAQNN